MAKRSGPLFVAIVGGSGSGKSHLAGKLREALGSRAGVLSLDDFYRDRSHLSPKRRARLNFDHPRSIDWPSFIKTLDHLAAGKPADVPVYDFAAHTRKSVGKKTAVKSIWIVDGLWLLAKRALRERFQVSVFLQCSGRTRLSRRLGRDCVTRGRTISSIKDQFRQTVEPMHRRFVEPQKLHADFVFKEGYEPEDLKELIERIKSAS